MTAVLMLCVLLWARDGQEVALAAYEDQVLQLVPAHGGRVVSRVRAVDGSDGSVDDPYEVHVIEFPSDDALDAYMLDPRRTALAEERDAAIARTQLLRVERV
jgi:uncharacterized protein (DUF1330 family)